MKNNNKKKIPNTAYYVIVVAIMIIINFFLLPRLAQEKIVEQTYDQFISQSEEKKIEKVNVLDTSIEYKLKDDDKIYTVKKFEYGEDRDLVNRLYENGAEIKRVSEKMNPVLSAFLSFGVQMLFIVLLWMFISKVFLKKMGPGGGAMNLGKSNAKIYAESTEGITFEDVAGQDEAKEALTEIVDFLHSPEKYASIGAKLPKGALLVGPPGTGKTLLARAVAGEAKVPFFSITGSDFVEMFVGLGAAKVRDLFQEANKKAPCIVFIDEIDTIGKKRDGAGFSGNDEREQTLNQLLSEMDGFDSNKGVVILGATNRPESLDPALLRPGRFDRRIPVDLPDLKGREDILKVHLKNVRHAPDLDVNFIARSTAGTSGADLANIVNEAALRAVKHGRKRVETEDLAESVEVVIAGYQKKNAVISAKEKEIIAYHEVGHALVAAKQTHSAPVTKITIVPRTSGALGYTMQVDEEEKYIYTKDDAFNKIVTFTGGRAAEELVFNTRTSGASNDIEQATRIARAMITQYGMNDEIGFVNIESRVNPYLGNETVSNASNETARLVDEQVRILVERAHEKAVNILKENMDKLHEISRHLLVKESITGEEFMAILEGKTEVEEESEENNIGEENKAVEENQVVEESQEGSED
ncbi:ATP-dependent zinc metalloprotease FtsH [Neofamilia massiliensis]|uniref:ATP-dependent zinc metalloprotease FtsH n=1 Tax=Neofamilia massiliensis TaxID=1673724 RepID=UPI0006BB5D4C|nr:ATP-dependent zinc metalloprotease FtsH [Neofamilia massiliensis]